MTARYFLIGETGDEGAWLVDVQSRHVERVEKDTLASGANVPDSDLVSNLAELRSNGDFNMLRGVNLAVAASTLAGPSGHTRREGGD